MILSCIAKLRPGWVYKTISKQNKQKTPKHLETKSQSNGDRVKGTVVHGSNPSMLEGSSTSVQSSLASLAPGYKTLYQWGGVRAPDNPGSIPSTYNCL